MPSKPAKKGLENESKVFRVDAARTELRKVLFKDLSIKPETYSFRNVEEDLDPEQLEPLRSDIAAQGINTPLLVIESDGDKYLVLDGHRRYFATLENIKKRIAGFSDKTEIPVHVLAKDASEQAKLARAISANVLREQLPPEGRIKGSCDLFKTGMPKAEIAKILGVSETQVKRDIDLGTNAEIMELVRRGFVSASTAASLLAVAIEAKRVPDMIRALTEHGECSLKEIAAIKRNRAAAKERPLSAAELLPKSRLTAEQVASWKTALKNGWELGEPEFGFFAGLIDDEKKKTRMIKISALRTEIDKLKPRNLAKVAKELANVLAQIAPVLKEQGTATARKPSPGADVNRVSAQLLADLQIGALVEKLAPDEVEEPEEVDDEEVDDEEVDDEEVDDEEVDDEEVDDEEVDEE